MYQGEDRRKHKVFLTQNTEYHMRGVRCVGVRRVGGQWQARHQALGRQLVGSIGTVPNGSYKVNFDGPPELGERLCFECDLMTTPITEVRRPERDVISQYVA